MKEQQGIAAGRYKSRYNSRYNPYCLPDTLTEKMQAEDDAALARKPDMAPHEIHAIRHIRWGFHADQ